MDTLHQIMLLCRPGFESECAAEILNHAQQAGFPAYINAKSGTGFALLVSPEGRDTLRLIEDIAFGKLVFTRQWFATGKKISELPERNRVPPLTDVAGQIALRLHRGFCDVELSYADTNEGKALSRFCRSFKPHMLTALKQQQLMSPDSGHRLHVFFTDSAAAWVGTSPVFNSAREPMGIPRLRMPPSAPSRSALKLEEAIHWFFDERAHSALFKPGMRAVDLGAAPGGWSWQLATRGLLVTAVDNGPMDEALMRSGMVEHVRGDAFTYQPASAVDWLVCDMVERPLHVSRLVASWFAGRHCTAAIFNLKLPMKKRYQTVLDCQQLLERSLIRAGIKYRLRIKQLYHDREEVTACLTTGHTLAHA